MPNIPHWDRAQPVTCQVLLGRIQSIAGTPIGEPLSTERRLPPFDLRLAMDTLAGKDPQLAPLIRETEEFRIETDGTESPYEALLEAIAYQSISGKAAATIYGRIKALSAAAPPPTPKEMLTLRKPALPQPPLSAPQTPTMTVPP